MKNLSEVFKYVSYLEEKYPVAEWIIDDVAIWPLVRIVLFRDILSQVNAMENLSSADQKKMFWLRFKQATSSVYKYPVAYFRDFKKNRDVDKNTQVLLINNGASYNKMRGEWFERFCDPIADALLEFNISSLRFDMSAAYLTPRYSGSKFVQIYIDTAIFKSLLLGKSANKYQVKLDKYSDFLQEIRDLKYKLFIPEVDYLKKRVFKIRHIQKYFEKKIKQGNIKAGLKVCYYSDDGMAFNLACKKHNIPSIDIQHGVQGNFHIAYGNWSTVPKGGYDLLPSHFWCWTQTDAQLIRSWADKAGGQHQSFVGGHPFLSIWTEGHPLFKYFTETLLAKAIPSQPLMLVTLSTGVSTEKHIGNLLSVVEKTQDQYNWYIRLHPFMSDEEKADIRKMLEGNNIHIYNMKEASESPLPVVLKHTDIHITYCSSVTLEASINQIPTILTDNYGATVFRNQVDDKLMIVALNEEDIARSISTLLSRTKLGEEDANLANFSKGIEYLSSLVEKSKHKK